MTDEIPVKKIIGPRKEPLNPPSQPRASEAIQTSAPTPELKISWQELGLSPELLSIVEKQGFTSPTPVQGKVISDALTHQDLIVSAQTGTGKTAAFVLPLVEKLKGRNGTFALILSPSREIALQTQEALEIFGAPMGVRSIALIGGVPLVQDEAGFKTNPHVLVATPGRLCDHQERGNIWLEYFEYVILDEADRMLDMGFSEALSKIFADIPKTRQTLLFSATFSPKLEKLAEKILNNPKRISIGKPTTAAKTVEQRFVFTHDKDKFYELQRLLREEPGTIFIFTRSKDRASQLWRSLHSRCFYEATHLHSDLRQSDREKALEDFKAGKYRVLIATDVVGRGIHVDNVSHVVNYDVPREAEDFIHRIGRTGRTGASGIATTFVTQRDLPVLRDIERVLGYKIRRPGPS